MTESGVAVVRAGFYCDESGNTGAHWGDPDQPTFVHGGWLVPNQSAAAVATEVVELRRRHDLRAAELKWQQLARRSDPGAIFRDFFQSMTARGCLPFFWVLDKDFITCAKVVETFFDPAYNSHYPSGFSEAREIKKELAEAVSHSTDVRSRFAALMRTGDCPTAGDIRDLTARLADHFQAGNAPMLANSLRNFSDDAISQIQDELSSDDWLRSTVGHSLPGLMQLLEGFMRKRPVELEIVHDNLVRYEPAFDMIRGMFRPSDGSDVVLVGGEPFYGSMPTVTRLRLADSKTEPMIQMADLLCGFVRTVFTKIRNGVELSASELAVCFHLAMCREEWMVWDANMPERMWKDFARLTVGGAAKGDVATVLEQRWSLRAHRGGAERACAHAAT